MVHKCTSVVSAGLVSDSAESRRPAAQLSRPSFPGPGRRAGIGEFGGASGAATRGVGGQPCPPTAAVGGKRDAAIQADGGPQAAGGQRPRAGPEGAACERRRRRRRASGPGPRKNRAMQPV